MRIFRGDLSVGLSTVLIVHCAIMEDSKSGAVDRSGGGDSLKPLSKQRRIDSVTEEADDTNKRKHHSSTDSD